MNPNNQDQNPEPDYGFITNLPEQSKPEKNNKRAKLAIIGMVAFVTIGAVLMIATATDKKVQDSKNIIANTTEDVVANHLALVSEGKLSESRQLFSNPNIATQEVYDFLWGTFMASTYNLKGCSVISSKDSSSRVYCPYRRDVSKGVYLIYTTSNGKIESIKNDV